MRLVEILTKIKLATAKREIATAELKAQLKKLEAPFNADLAALRATYKTAEAKAIADGDLQDFRPVYLVSTTRWGITWLAILPRYGSPAYAAAIDLLKDKKGVTVEIVSLKE